MLSIKWTEHARREKVEILKFWIKNNQSNIYSQKIKKETQRKLSLLKKNSLMGEEVEDFNEVRRILVLENFSLFYTIEVNEIKILSFWDNRRNPENLEI